MAFKYIYNENNVEFDQNYEFIPEHVLPWWFHLECLQDSVCHDEQQYPKEKIS